MSLPVFKTKKEDIISVSAQEYCVACYTAWEFMINYSKNEETSVSFIQRQIIKDTNILVFPDFIATLIKAMYDNYWEENFDHPYGILCQDAFMYVSNLLINGDIKYDRPVKFKDNRTYIYYNKKLNSFSNLEDRFAWKRRFISGEKSRGYNVVRTIDEIWIIKDTDEAYINENFKKELLKSKISQEEIDNISKSFFIYKKIEKEGKLFFEPIFILEENNMNGSRLKDIKDFLKSLKSK